MHTTNIHITNKTLVHSITKTENKSSKIPTMLHIKNTQNHDIKTNENQMLRKVGIISICISIVTTIIATALFFTIPIAPLLLILLGSFALGALIGGGLLLYASFTGKSFVTSEPSIQDHPSTSIKKEDINRFPKPTKPRVQSTKDAQSNNRPELTNTTDIESDNRAELTDFTDDQSDEVSELMKGEYAQLNAKIAIEKSGKGKCDSVSMFGIKLILDPNIKTHDEFVKKSLVYNEKSESALSRLHLNSQTNNPFTSLLYHILHNGCAKPCIDELSSFQFQCKSLERGYYINPVTNQKIMFTQSEIKSYKYLKITEHFLTKIMQQKIKLLQKEEHQQKLLLKKERKQQENFYRDNAYLFKKVNHTLKDSHILCKEIFQHITEKKAEKKLNELGQLYNLLNEYEPKIINTDVLKHNQELYFYFSDTKKRILACVISFYIKKYQYDDHFPTQYDADIAYANLSDELRLLPFKEVIKRCEKYFISPKIKF